MSKLLINEPPLQVLPTLATKIGLNEAIFLQQLHYWTTSPIAKAVDGHYWIYNKVDKWVENFPFWSKRTIERIIAKLETEKLIIPGNYNQSRYDRTKWYRINYDALNELEKEPENPSETPSRQDGGMDNDASRQNGGMEPDKVADSSSRQNGGMTSRQNGGMKTDKVAGPIPETTTKTTPKITKKSTYREFVTLTPTQYQSLIEKYGQEQTEVMLDMLDNYKGANGKAYKDDYRAILSWVVKKYNEEHQKGAAKGNGTTQLPRAYQSLQDWAEAE